MLMVAKKLDIVEFIKRVKEHLIKGLLFPIHYLLSIGCISHPSFEHANITFSSSESDHVRVIFRIFTNLIFASIFGFELLTFSVF